jgi:thiol-disulfide isomerase/thioredoxin
VRPHANAVLTCCVVLLLSVSAHVALGQGVGGFRVGDRAPVIEVNDLDGKPHDLGQYLGHQPVLLEFWATWCELCEALLPRVRQAAAEFGDEIRFIGINIAVNQSAKRVRLYVEEHHPPFLTLYDNLGTSVRAFHVPTTSYVVIVDGGGIIRYVGVGGDQDLSQALRAVVRKEEPDRQP